MDGFDPQHPLSRKNGRYPDIIGACIAEMDYPVAKPIRDVLLRNIEGSLLSYVDTPSRLELPRATAAWLKQQLDWHVEPAQVFIVGDVIAGYESVMRLLAPPPLPIVIPTPAYHLLLSTPHCFGRNVREVPCLRDDDAGGRFLLDYDAIAAALEPGALFVLTNPYNPVGQAYTRAELLRLVDVIDEAGALVFSDEIHFPIILDEGLRHVPYASLDERARRHTITAVSASKPFNLAALHCAQLIIQDKGLRDAWKPYGFFYGDATSRLGVHAAIVAYSDPACKAWLDDVLVRLRANREIVHRHFAARHPGTWVSSQEATYLVWVDVRSLLPMSLPEAFLLDKAKVSVSGGESFSTPGFIRINIALEPEILQRALEGISTAIETHRRKDEFKR
ncbi:MAG: aminotransferase class I/II-fold pyridoxal phosphate-dependent enzyme [Coriobacteriales bacterium]|jgi:cystathionine beta-lyase|nr:aminotransferase class I/II-fold pyridoxal phosphate-dependent enzyme [Coriobacteriales bacterium]